MLFFIPVYLNIGPGVSSCRGYALIFIPISFDLSSIALKKTPPSLRCGLKSIVYCMTGFFAIGCVQSFTAVRIVYVSEGNNVVPVAPGREII